MSTEMKGYFMSVAARLLMLLNLKMATPAMYGWFHILWLVITVSAAVFLCRAFHKGTPTQARRIILITAILVTVLEAYKQINYTFSVGSDGTVTADYQWYAFPFQFCSTPMYVGLLAGLIRKGKLHDALCAYLATYAVFAGVCVMVYPADVFIDTIGINVQTMVCHSSMITVGAYLLYAGYVKMEHKTILRAMPVFAICVALAAIMNEIAHATGLLETETFNMFFISPYCAPSLPVYSLVQNVVPFPWCLIIYILAFSLAAYIILLLAMLMKRLTKKSITV